MRIVIDEIEIQVTKKNVKNMNLYVKPPDGRVVMSVPNRISDEKIESFVRKNLEWIRKRQKYFAQLPQQTAMKYETGDTIYVWGKQYQLKVLYENKKSTLTLEGNTAIFTVRENSTAEQREKFVTEWYRSILKTEIETFLAKWETVTGLHADSWQIKKMKTKWGTCNVRTRKLWFSLQLAKLKPECLDYVVLHELLHLEVPNHGADYAAMLDFYMPNWRVIHQQLNAK